MKTEINNQQNKHAINLPAVRRFLSCIAEFVTKEDHTSPWKEIALVLMDDAGISSVNSAYFNKCRPTDVISFRYTPNPEEDGKISGEVLVNVQRAHEEGLRRGDRNHELALYIAHGCLHLTGADDHTASERAAMQRKQSSWIQHLPPSIPLTFFRHE